MREDRQIAFRVLGNGERVGKRERRKERKIRGGEEELKVEMD